MTDASTAPRLRVLATNDFNARVAPTPTTWGFLPGATGLAATVEELSADQPTIWVDGGDLCNGWLDELAGRDAAWDVGRTLPVTVGVLGNHELDQGVDAARRHHGRLGHPLLCANADLGCDADVILSVAGLEVGVIGVTHPRLDLFVPGAPQPGWAGGQPLRDAVQGLRRRGADIVVAAIHDGVRWYIHGDRRVKQRTAEFASLLRNLEGAVDLVVAGHTIGRWIGHIGAVPVLQPWVFGAEVGVADLLPDGTWRLGGVRCRSGTHWTGVGGAAIDRAATAIVGSADHTWTMHPGARSYLPDLLALSILDATGADAAVVPAPVVFTQPAIDGVTAHLPAGDISELDLIGLIHLAYDPLFLLAMTDLELSAMLARIDEPAHPDSTLDEPWTYLRMRAGLARRSSASSHATVAVPAPWGDQLSRWLGRSKPPDRSSISRREALRRTLAGSVSPERWPGSSPSTTGVGR